MKRKIAIFSIIIIFVLGIGVMSYPLISSFVNNIASRSQATEYKKSVAQMPDEETEKLINEAKDYNKNMSGKIILTDPFDAEAYQKIGVEYQNTLKINDEGLMGYIDIPKINVYLPIYHGTSPETLAKGAGHLQNTSLPVGGESSHSVISAHSAFPGETFFDYLTDMQEGDEFFVHILDKTLKYEVDQIYVVLPEEVDKLRIVNGGDYVTLLTCTPYTINTHRLLVRGKRVPYDDTKYIETGASVASFDSSGIFFLGYKIPYWAAFVSIIVFIALVVFLVVFFVKRSNKRKKSKSDNNAEGDT